MVSQIYLVCRGSQLNCEDDPLLVRAVELDGIRGLLVTGLGIWEPPAAVGTRRNTSDSGKI